MIRGLLVLTLCVFGCKQPEEVPDLLDTGWFDDTDSYDPEDCAHTFVDVQPSAGEQQWYWRTPPRFWTSSESQGRYTAKLIDPNGFVVDTAPQWDEAGLSFVLPLPNSLRPNSLYTLQYADCLGPREHTFQTSPLGAPLEEGPSSLRGRTWQLDIVNANWVEPGGFSALLQLYFTVPLLIGVEWADAQLIDLVGAPGWVDETGEIHQDRDEPAWDFPVTGFAGAPYFVSETEQAAFGYADVSIPVYDLAFTGTFSADGTRMGGATMEGIGDTREMGGLFGQPGELNAVCELAESLGVSCVPCPDGEAYCLLLRAEDAVGYEVSGLTLIKQ